MINEKYVNNGGFKNYTLFPMPEGEGVYGMILHADGGARPNPGHAGWGIHGYLFQNDKPKQGSGLQDNVVTATGYVDRYEYNAFTDNDPNKPKEVTPIMYVDGYGSFADPATNNVAELTAATHALLYATQYNIKTLHIYTDSEYVCRGMYGWVPACRKNNWIKSDGEVAKNVEYWKNLCAAYDALIHRGVEVNISWIAAHSGLLGNEIADAMATIGVMASKSGRHVNEINSTPAKGYWKNNFNIHPFLNHPCLYFNTLSHLLQPGEYYCGNQRILDMLGTRISDGAFSVLRLSQPEQSIEILRNHQSALASEMDTIISAKLDKLWRPGTLKQLMTYGNLALVQNNKYRLDLSCLDKELVTEAADPAKLAMRAVEDINLLELKFKEYLNGNKTIITTDLTSIIYETSVNVDKKGESTTKVTLKPEYGVGYASLKVNANYETPDGVSAVPVTLTLGIDLLDRNALKRLEDMNPKVTLITWLEAPKVFRYATVVETGNDKGIWAGMYSNLRVVLDDKQEAVPVHAE